MFQFKQFTIKQDQCAMKVGTDGVLLGAWTPINSNIYTVLDIGAGTGLIALMLAQRTHAEQIDAIEIDASTYEQCVDNFEQSPWNDRLFCYHADLKTFIEEFEDEETYDLIVSNPPYFSENYSSGNQARDTARFQKSLPFDLLIKAVDTFLSDTGLFCIILPFSEEEKFINLAENQQIYPTKITRVKGTDTSPIKRSLIAFSKQKTTTEIDELVVEISRHQYTKEFKKLTQDFYLDK